MTSIASWPAQAEAWLDERGKPAWIAATILAFVVFWPAGLALLAYLIWGKRMFSLSFLTRNGWSPGASRAFRSSGNSAFDAYKAETLKRLEEEQAAFEAFLQRLREARDKAEFDQFMEERARRARSGREREAGPAEA